MSAIFHLLHSSLVTSNNSWCHFYLCSFQLSFCIGRVDRHCEDIPVIMESGHEGRDMLQQGREAIEEMNKMAELLSEQGEVFNRRAMTELETTLGPPLAVTGALNRVSSELQGLLRRANTTDRIWQQGVSDVKMNIELSDFRANHMQVLQGCSCILSNGHCILTVFPCITLVFSLAVIVF